MSVGPGAALYRPASALAEYTQIIGHWHARVGYRSRALPRGAVTLIIDVGQRRQVDFFAADGCTGLSQVVILAAGMDARSYRLPWRDGATVFEVDQPHVIAIKDERLTGERSRARRVTVGVDLAGDWPKKLAAQGFNAAAPTIWLVEGLLQYLEAPDVDRLFARLDGISAPGSVLLYDVVGTALMATPFLAATLSYMEKLGAPWVFSSDTPAALVEDRGWTATLTDMAVPGNKWGRWPHPPVPADVPDAPRGYFVAAVKA